MDTKYSVFSVSVYGEFEKFTETISKARCRIFYKGENRNGSFITDEFAEKLLSTLPYTPVKGIYDELDEDYTDHGEERNLGRIYGIVPENPNVTWEDHQDEDGVTRSYACTDVLIFTAIYPEASEILSKSQSMELYPPSIMGHQQRIGGQEYFVFEEGCFLGLQILGDDIPPCFEGAAFFSLCESVKELTEKLQQLSNNFSKGGKVMDKLNFQLSDREKFDAIWSLLNVNYNEENGYAIDYDVIDTYDDYAIVLEYATKQIFKLQFSTGENNSIALGDREEVFGMFLNQEEKDAIEALRNDNSALKEENEELKGTVQEKDEALSALQEEKATVDAQLEEANISLNSLKEENATLSEYKESAEKKAKDAVIKKYSTKLNSDIIKTYSDNLTDYTVKELEKELAFELVQNTPDIFSLEIPPVVPKPEPQGSLEEYLAKIENK